MGNTIRSEVPAVGRAVIAAGQGSVFRQARGRRGEPAELRSAVQSVLTHEAVRAESEREPAASGEALKGLHPMRVRKCRRTAVLQRGQGDGRVLRVGSESLR